MNPPQVYPHSPSWTLFPPPSPTLPLGRPSAPAPSIQYHALNLDTRSIFSPKIFLQSSSLFGLFFSYLWIQFFFFSPIKQCPSPPASFSVNLLSLWLSRWHSGKRIHLPKQETQRRRVPFLVLGRCPGEGNGNPLQYPFLGDSMDRGPGGLQSMGSRRIRQNWATGHACTKSLYFPSSVSLLSKSKLLRKLTLAADCLVSYLGSSPSWVSNLE